MRLMPRQTTNLNNLGFGSLWQTDVQLGLSVLHLNPALNKDFSA